MLVVWQQYAHPPPFLGYSTGEAVCHANDLPREGGAHIVLATEPTRRKPVQTSLFSFAQRKASRSRPDQTGYSRPRKTGFAVSARATKRSACHSYVAAVSSRFSSAYWRTGSSIPYPRDPSTSEYTVTNDCSVKRPSASRTSPGPVSDLLCCLERKAAREHSEAPARRALLRLTRPVALFLRRIRGLEASPLGKLSASATRGCLAIFSGISRHTGQCSPGPN